MGEDDYGNTIKKLPENSRYIKSEDILYEIKKIQQKQILSDGMEYDYVKRGNRAERLHDHVEMLREYLVQIRGLYQSLIAKKNRP